MFASRDIEKGECIVAESNVEVLMQQVNAEHPHIPISSAASNEMITVCGPNIARVNHSCSRWNSAYANETLGGRELRATASIAKGEEITQCYKTNPILQFTQPEGSVEARATNNVNRARMCILLKKQFGFTCSCQDCFQERACFVCKKRTQVKRCSQCGVVWYCGREHQLADWKQHKAECKGWSATKKDLEARAEASSFVPGVGWKG